MLHKLIRFSVKSKSWKTEERFLLLPENETLPYFRAADGVYAQGICIKENIEKERRAFLKTVKGKSIARIEQPAIFAPKLQEFLETYQPDEEVNTENWPRLCRMLAELFSDSYQDAENLAVLHRRMLHSNEFLEFLSFTDRDTFTNLSVDEILRHQQELKIQETKTITLSRLKNEFHFSEKMIKELLPEPILAKNPHYACAAPMKLFRIKHVEQAMQTETYQTEMVRQKKRIESGKKAAATRERRRREKLEAERLEREMLKKEWKEVLICSKPQDYYPKARAMKRHFVIHCGPTNSGKTYEALKAFRESSNGIYLAPLRLLACEVAEETNQAGIPCSMLTGEEQSMLAEASHLSCTAEMADLNEHYEVAVIDECQMVADSVRGGVWSQAIMGLCAQTIHLCTAPQALEALCSIIDGCNDSYEIEQCERLVPLAVLPSIRKGDLKKGDACIVFSRKSVYLWASRLRKRGLKVSVLYGALPYEVKRKEAEKFASGKSDVVVATDCIGMGMNLPIERVVFLEGEKFDGCCVRSLYADEVQQIAGRAGRYGKFATGYCGSLAEGFKLESLLHDKVGQKTAVLKAPPLLASLNGRLSDKLKFWQSLSFPGFRHENANERILKAEFLEQKTTLEPGEIQAYASIPFRWDDEYLQDLWYSAICDHLAWPYFAKYVSRYDLESLEYYHRCLELFEHLCRIENETDLLQKASEEKQQVSYEIMECLQNKFS